VTFSNLIEDYVVKNFSPKVVGEFRCVNGLTPIYVFDYNGKTFGFYKTLLGAPASVGIMEDVNGIIDTKKYIVFGSAGILNKEECMGKVVIPTSSYRDEGTSYHYAKPSDYIDLKYYDKIKTFMDKYKIPNVLGKCWTTDAFYRETTTNLTKRKNEGCLVVDMECSALQALCDFRGLSLYYLMFCGDILDAPEWDESNLHNANHDIKNFDIVLHLADEI